MLNKKIINKKIIIGIIGIILIILIALILKYKRDKEHFFEGASQDQLSPAWRRYFKKQKKKRERQKKIQVNSVVLLIKDILKILPNYKNYDDNNKVFYTHDHYVTTFIFEYLKLFPEHKEPLETKLKEELGIEILWGDKTTIEYRITEQREKNVFGQFIKDNQSSTSRKIIPEVLSWDHTGIKYGFPLDSFKGIGDLQGIIEASKSMESSVKVESHKGKEYLVRINPYNLVHTTDWFWLQTGHKGKQCRTISLRVKQIIDFKLNWLSEDIWVKKRPRSSKAGLPFTFLKEFGKLQGVFDKTNKEKEKLKKFIDIILTKYRDMLYNFGWILDFAGITYNSRGRWTHWYVKLMRIKKNKYVKSGRHTFWKPDCVDSNLAAAGGAPDIDFLSLGEPVDIIGAPPIKDMNKDYGGGKLKLSDDIKLLSNEELKDQEETTKIVLETKEDLDGSTLLQEIAEN